MNFIELFNDNKNAVYELTRKQVKTQYRGSVLGFVWTILNPMLTMLVMWLVFTSIFGRDDPYYALYLLTGTILFSALRNSTTQALQSIVQNRGLLLRTKVQPSIFPLSNTLTSIVNFGFSLIALIPFMIWLSISLNLNLFTYRLVFILLMLPAFLLFEFGLGLFLSCTFVFFRDIKHLYAVLLTLWNYLTPIFYNLKNMKPVVVNIIKINPMFHFVNYFRDAVYRGAAGVDYANKMIGSFNPLWSELGNCYIFGIAAVLIGLIVYKLLQKKMILRV